MLKSSKNDFKTTKKNFKNSKKKKNSCKYSNFAFFKVLLKNFLNTY